MSSPLNELIPSLLFTSKSALQRGQALCTRANDNVIASSSLAVDALSADARVRWAVRAVSEQLAISGEIVKGLVARRVKVLDDIKKWDALRDEATEALDSQLDRLEHILVPPSIHAPRLSGEGTVDPFEEVDGEESDEDGMDKSTGVAPQNGATNGSKKANGKVKDPHDRSKWKCLRDFVDEREVDDLMERMEADRTVLDEALRNPDIPTPHTLTSSIAHLKSSLPKPTPPLTATIHALLQQQEDLTSTMSIALESLTTHYEQMMHALDDVRSGVPIDSEDVDVLVRDTQEVGPILEELEQATGSVAEVGDRLRETGRDAGEGTQVLDRVWDGLEALRLGMGDVAEHLALLEETTTATLPVLNAHLAAVSSLQSHFHEVEKAYHALVLELDRRAASKGRALRLIREMESQLAAWHSDEAKSRAGFLSSAGEWLPEHLCPGMSDPPEEWEVRPLGLEGNVEVPEDIVLTARRALS